MKRFLIATAFVALVLSAVSCWRESAPFRNVAVGDVLPSFSVEMSDGTVVTDKSLKGGPSVLVSFGPGCPDCKWQFDEMQKAYSEKPDACAWVAVSRGLADKVPSYMADNGYTFPWSAQKDRKVYEMFSDKGIPSMYVNDRNGVVRYVHYDDCMVDADALLEEIRLAGTLW